MRYGYFDDEKKEYVIDRPDTPKSWSNYLGTTRYGAIITNNAGGYSFFHSTAQGRFLRLRFNAIPMDQPGRYLYLYDKNSKDYWSTSWQPVGKPLDKYKSECRHGSAYTIISSDYSEIQTETLFFVPMGKDLECWRVKITNTGKTKRSLRAFTYVEFASNWNAGDDMGNLQYTQYIIKTAYENGVIDHGSNIFMPEQPENFQEKDQARHTFIGCAGAKVTGFDTDREKFLGNYRTYANPIVVEQGECQNNIAEGDNGCGTLQIDIDLEPGESKIFTIVLGIGKGAVEGQAAIKEFADPAVVQKAWDEVKAYWHGRIEGLTANTPDPQFNSMINMWNPFNNLMTFAWSRAASLVYSGERDGLGYRDTIQDMIGVLHNIPEEAGERLELMITGQVSTGGAMPVVKPFAHNPGREKAPDEHHYRSDDCMWLFNTIPAYVKETNNIEFYNKVLPYSDKGSDTVLGHMRRAIEFNLNRMGAHGLPCGLHADWNDCLVLGQRGETVFVALQLRFAFITYIEICEHFGKKSEIEWAQKNLATLDKNIEAHAWDGEWYMRAYREDGLKFGSKDNDEGSIFLNPQSWGVISQHATGDRAKLVMDKVNERLATEYGIMLCDPPYEKTDPSVIKAPLFNKGMKENAAIFNHTQGWAVMAETMLGRGNQAYKYYKSYLPAAYNEIAEIRESEPYVYSQSTHSKHNLRFGASRLPWLSGTATWAYFSAAQYVLGIRPTYNGLEIDPCIPSEWLGFTATRRFVGKTVKIKVDNPHHVEKGVSLMSVNGEPIEGTIIPINKLTDVTEVVITLGKK
ncbi:MAG: N,N'-diacetylchitobiose phosphorylase [Bacteroidales bacterium]|nr:N,N'-diacetylchitobiose phosphorylase [Bacteroidales bacterium]